MASYSDITSAHAISYRPIMEYGGWGLRFPPGKRVLTVSGERGGQLELSSGKKRLVGSQQADALVRALLPHLR